MNNPEPYSFFGFTLKDILSGGLYIFLMLLAIGGLLVFWFNLIRGLGRAMGAAI